MATEKPKYEPFLAVEKKERIPINEENIAKLKPEDIIVLKKDKVIIEYKDDGTRIERQTYKKVYVTKMINETAKLVKVDTAEEKLLELKEAIEKELGEIKK